MSDAWGTMVAFTNRENSASFAYWGCEQDLAGAKNSGSRKKGNTKNN